MFPAAGPVGRPPMLRRCRPALPRQWIQALLLAWHPVNCQVCLHRHLQALCRAGIPAAGRVRPQAILQVMFRRRCLHLSLALRHRRYLRGVPVFFRQTNHPIHQMDHQVRHNLQFPPSGLP